MEFITTLKSVYKYMKLPAPDYQGAEEAILQKLGKELPKSLTYHGKHHTLDVLEAGMTIAETEKSKEEIYNY